MTRSFSRLSEKWLRDSRFRAEYERQEPAFETAFALANARNRAGLTQKQLAARLKTSQSQVARIESGRHLPSVRMIERYAKALNCDIKIELVPTRSKRAA
ncbi:MAG: helix-turn-helix domain-containing protein [Dongiaceae bacterium]